MHELIYGNNLNLMNISIALYWMLGLGLLCVKNRDIDHVLTALVLFAISFWMLFDDFNEINSYRLIAFHVGFTFIRAPLIYFYFLKIIEPRFVFTREKLYHFIPGILIFLLLEICDASDPLSGTSILFMIRNHDVIFSALLIQVLVITGLALHFVYLIYLLKKYLPLFLIGSGIKQELPNSAIVWLHIFYTLAATGVIICEYIASGQMQELSLFLLIIFPVLFFFAIMRYPEYIRLVKVETEQISYARSKIQGLNLDIIFRQMEDLIQVEKVYLDETMTLPKLADQLSITAHQLSEILNNKLGKTFSDYINEYRIEEAQRLLIEVPEANVLDIAFDVGFNTKSAFYKAFHKISGQTPGQYRKNHGRNSGL